MTPDGVQCNPMTTGCKALEAVKGYLENKKANKDYVDTEVKELSKKMDKHRTYLISILISTVLLTLGLAANLVVLLVRG